MKTMHIVVGITAAVAALSLAPLRGGAQAHGLVAHATHFGGHFAGHFRFPAAHFRFRAPRQRDAFWPSSGLWYGGVHVLLQSAPAAATQPTAPLPIKSCRYLRQSVTVPAEAGGTTQITITRC